MSYLIVALKHVCVFTDVYSLQLIRTHVSALQTSLDFISPALVVLKCSVMCFFFRFERLFQASSSLPSDMEILVLQTAEDLQENGARGFTPHSYLSLCLLHCLFFTVRLKTCLVLSAVMNDSGFVFYF